MLRQTAALSEIPPRELCKTKWLYYQGDNNYGLGNVLYDVSSAVAFALALNRTLLYGANEADRKFGTLLTWPGILTLADADSLRRRARCGSGPLTTQRRVLLAPDRCTFHRTWRKERSGHVRCFKRLLGTNWLAERVPLLELSKVHAFTGVQTLLKSAHEPLRRRLAALTGGCVHSRARPNIHGAFLAALMQPAPAVMHAVRWALSQQHGATPPPLALHVRAMSDFRARNLTARDQAEQMSNALLCVHRAASLATVGGTAVDEPSILVVSSSPELRGELVKQMSTRRHGQLGLRPVVFDWRRYMLEAPRDVAIALASSENAVRAPLPPPPVLCGACVQTLVRICARF